LAEKLDWKGLRPFRLIPDLYILNYVKQKTGLEFSLLPVLTNDVHSFRLTMHKPLFFK
jgi:hypothetical protein